MLNRITIMGRLTWDPELRRTQSGIAVARFRLAVDRDFKSQNGERETDFIDCVAWRNTAEFVSKYFAKGRMAIVDGSLQVRDWTDNDGQKRRNAEVVANSVYFGDSKRDTASDYGNAPGYGNSPNHGNQSGYDGSDYGGAPSGYGSNPGYGADFSEADEDNDLPF